MENKLKVISNNIHSESSYYENNLLMQYPNNNIQNQKPNFMLKKSTLSKCLTAFMFMLITFVATAQTQSSFTVNSTQECLNGNSFVFANTSTSGAGITYTWNFGDGTTSTLANPTKTYTAFGNYSVQLVTRKAGIDYYFSRTVTVSPMPVASFYNIVSTQNGNSYTFISTSTIANGVMDYFWDFGDGTTSTLINPVKSYNAVGNYNVKLVITSDGGCKDSVTHTVSVVLTDLNASFNVTSLTTQCLSGNSFSFYNSSNTGVGITYFWNFGSGATPSTYSGQTPPSVTYSTVGVKTITLTTSATGATPVTDTVTVSVVGDPYASFTYSNTYNNYTFISTSINRGTLSWSFGDGATSNYDTAYHTYNAAGNYTVRLIVTNANHSDTTYQSIVVAAPPALPVAAFNVSSAVAQCFNTNSFTFNNTSTGSGNTYRWTFPNAVPDSSLSSNPGTVVFNSYGFYTVTLVVTNAAGTSTFTQNVTVGPKPTPSFSYSVDSTYKYTFFNGSYIAQGTITSYNWTLDGVNFSTAQNPATQVLSNGSHVVKLFVTSNVGCVDSISQTIGVGSAPPPAGYPVAAFSVTSATSQCQAGNSFTVNNTSTGNAIKYHWSFPNATPSSDTTATPPAVVFNSYGTYTITLVVTDTLGSSVATQTVTVIPKPTASFSYSVDSTYKHTFFNGSYISISSALTYNWKLDGVTFSTALNPAQQLFSAGVHTVTLTVTSATGCKDSSVQIITVGVTPPPSGSAVAAFNVSSSTSQCLAGNSFTFNNTSTGVGNTYLWTFPNATPATDTAANPGTVVFNGYGKYTITLLAKNLVGTTTTTHTLTVGPKPTASFSSSNNANVYTFFNGSYIAQDTIASYNWTLDGISFSTAKNPVSQTLTGGTHTVKLFATSNIGCIDSTSQTFTVAAKPTAAFVVTTATTQCKNGNSFTFSNTTSGSGVSYIWNFGDGTGSGSATPTKSYSTAGTYTVKLYAINSGGIDSTTQTIIVTAGTSANFGYSAAGSVVTFSDSSVGAFSYAWNFGDGFTSILTNPTRNYASLGTYTVKLITTSATGCKDSISRSVTAGTLPTASFTITSATTQCSNNNSFTFNNTSTTGAGITYLWSFGDTTATTYNPFAKTYDYSGTIPVTLSVTNGLGTVSTTQNVIVLAGPKASFVTYSNSNSGNSYTFISTSTVPAGNMTYTWDLGDGSTSSLVNPTHTYAAPGTYTVKLVVNGGSPCADSTTHTVTFCPTVTAKFGVTSTTSQCLTGNSFTFADSSTTNATSGYTIAYTWSFGDSTFSSLQNPLAHTYAAWGDYDVKLKVKLTSGACVASDSITKLKLVSAQPMPVASYRLILDNFYVPTALLSDTTKRCWHYGYDFSYQSSSVLGRGTMDYLWHFGTSALYFRDGDSSHYINPRIVFDTAGIYPVKLVVVSDKGCKDSVTRIVHLSDPRSRFNFTIDSSNVYASPIVSVTDASYDRGGYLVSWNWIFGGSVANASGQYPASPNASFSYTCGGTYPVKLSVTSDVGCTVDTTRNITVRIRPHAAFSISAPNYTPTVYFRPTFMFTNSTTVNDACPAMSYTWNFGDGNSSSATNPTHIYTASGTYTVTLISTNGNGGKKDTITNTVLVAIKPKAAFSTSQSLTPNNYAAPTVIYTNGSTVADAATSVAALGYYWDLGDGTTSNVANPANHQYAAGGTYTVTLIVTNPVSGLKDTVSHNVTVKVKPKAAFSSNVDYGGDIYSNPVVSFTDATTANDASATFTYSWNFGDATFSNLQNPIGHIYAAGGTYNVTLTVTNANGGLVDVVSHNVVITITPKAILSVHIDTISTPIPMSIGNANYKHYTLTALSNLANPSNIVTGSIAHTDIKIDTVYIPSAATAPYADVTDADAEFAIQLDTVPNYLFNVTLTVTSDLGVTDVTTATLGAIEGGFTQYRLHNPASITPIIKLPSIGGSTAKPIVPVAMPKVQTLSVYPNPGKDNVNVSVIIPAKVAAITVRMYSANGKLVQQQKQDVNATTASNKNLNLNTSNLAVGTYSIVIVDDKGITIGNTTFVKGKE